MIIKKTRRVDWNNKKLVVDFNINYKKCFIYGDIFSKNPNVEFVDVLDDYTLRIIYNENITTKTTKNIIDYYFDEQYKLIKINATITTYDEIDIISVKNIILKKSEDLYVNQIKPIYDEDFVADSMKLSVKTNLIVLDLQGE